MSEKRPEEKLPWRKPQVEDLEASGPPQCNPAFPQAQVCAANGFPQSTIGCNIKSVFS